MLTPPLHADRRREPLPDREGEALAINPDQAEALCNLGNALVGLRRYAEAAAAYDKAVAIKPDYADAFNNRGIALLELNRPAQALESYDRALAIRPDHAQALYNRGNVLSALKRPSEALASYDRAIAAKPDYADAFNNRGNALQELKRPLEAIASYDRALAIQPTYVEAHENKGILLGELGQFALAEAALATAIKLAPQRTRSHFHLTLLRRTPAGDPHLAIMEHLARRIDSLTPSEQVDLNFALAKAYEDSGDSERSFRRLVAGNALKRKTFVYHEDSTLRVFKRLIETFTADAMRLRPDVGEPSDAPVFIFGMPRSGSTLVEQILASHPSVFALGEVDDFENAIAGLRDGAGNALQFPEMFAALSAQLLRRLGASYLQSVGAADSAAARVTDKRPANFLYAGLIHLALPKARMIHTRRDAIDTCWSCFSQRFADSGSLPCAYDLGELGRYYRAYDGLMAHWRSVLPQDVMLEVQYEDVVEDIEAQARRILVHCGLEWDPRCLDFHRTERQVRTVSVAQVRQPIYTNAVGRWRRFEPFLGPLLRELADGSPAAA